MAYIPLTKDQLEKVIADKFGKPDGVTYDGNAIVTFFVDNIYSNTKDRLDQLETDYDSLLTALTALAAALSAIPITAAAGAALATAMTAQATDAVTRATAKATQEALPKPYLDGGK